MVVQNFNIALKNAVWAKSFSWRSHHWRYRIKREDLEWLSVYVNNLDVRQSRQANDSASIVKRAKERLRNNEMPKKAQQEAK